MENEKERCFISENQSTTIQKFREKSYVGIKNPFQLVTTKTEH
jgi:hypothetical protein